MVAHVFARAGVVLNALYTVAWGVLIGIAAKEDLWKGLSYTGSIVTGITAIVAGTVLCFRKCRAEQLIKVCGSIAVFGPILITVSTGNPDVDSRWIAMPSLFDSAVAALDSFIGLIIIIAITICCTPAAYVDVPSEDPMQMAIQLSNLAGIECGNTFYAFLRAGFATVRAALLISKANAQWQPIAITGTVCTALGAVVALVTWIYVLCRSCCACTRSDPDPDQRSGCRKCCDVFWKVVLCIGAVSTLIGSVMTTVVAFYVYFEGDAGADVAKDPVWLAVVSTLVPTIVFIVGGGWKFITAKCCT